MKDEPISVPGELYLMIKEKVKRSKGEFMTVDEYVVFVLKEILEPESAYSKQDEAEIMERLKSLGYA